MSAFNYQALDRDGRLVKGIMEGDSERQIRALLRTRQLKPASVTAITDSHAANLPNFQQLLKSRARLNPRDLALLTRQLASLVQSGLPLDEALLITAKQCRKPAISSLMHQVRSRVTEGQSLAAAMTAHPQAFNRMYCSMVRAGESAGFLGEVLERLADHSDTSQLTRQRIRMAMIYPAALLAVSLVVVGLLMSLVVPKLVSIFENSSRELPRLTTMLIDVSHFMTSLWALAVVVLIVLVFAGFKAWLRVSSNLEAWHRLLAGLPLIGSLIVQTDTARFAATLSVLLDSGVPLIEGLKIAGAVMGNLALRNSALQVSLAVQEGESLTRALTRAEVFPPLMIQMAANGEANGTLAKQLAFAARSQERDLEMSLGTAMALLEPLTIVFMGGLVAIIMMAILLPMFDINSFV